MKDIVFSKSKFKTEIKARFSNEATLDHLAEKVAAAMMNGELFDDYFNAVERVADYLLVCNTATYNYLCNNGRKVIIKD